MQAAATTATKSIFQVIICIQTSNPYSHCLEAAINATQHVQVISGDWHRPPAGAHCCAAVTAQQTQGSGQGSLNAI
jgi:hypothetical protein